MANSSQVLTTEPAIITGLADGSRYRIQNRAEYEVFLEEATSAPDRISVSAGVLHPRGGNQDTIVIEKASGEDWYVWAYYAGGPTPYISIGERTLMPYVGESGGPGGVGGGSANVGGELRQRNTGPGVGLFLSTPRADPSWHIRGVERQLEEAAVQARVEIAGAGGASVAFLLPLDYMLGAPETLNAEDIEVTEVGAVRAAVRASAASGALTLTEDTPGFGTISFSTSAGDPLKNAFARVATSGGSLDITRPDLAVRARGTWPTPTVGIRVEYAAYGTVGNGFRIDINGALDTTQTENYTVAAAYTSDTRLVVTITFNSTASMNVAYSDIAAAINLARRNNNQLVAAVTQSGSATGTASQSSASGSTLTLSGGGMFPGARTNVGHVETHHTAARVPAGPETHAMATALALDVSASNAEIDGIVVTSLIAGHDGNSAGTVRGRLRIITGNDGTIGVAASNYLRSTGGSVANMLVTYYQTGTAGNGFTIMVVESSTQTEDITAVYTSATAMTVTLRQGVGVSYGEARDAINAVRHNGTQLITASTGHAGSGFITGQTRPYSVSLSGGAAASGTRDPLAATWINNSARLEVTAIATDTLNDVISKIREINGFDTTNVALASGAAGTDLLKVGPNLDDQLNYNFSGGAPATDEQNPLRATWDEDSGILAIYALPTDPMVDVAAAIVALDEFAAADLEYSSGSTPNTDVLTFSGASVGQHHDYPFANGTDAAILEISGDPIRFPSFYTFGVSGVIPGVTTAQELVDFINGLDGPNDFVTASVTSGSSGTDTFDSGLITIDVAGGDAGQPAIAMSVVLAQAAIEVTIQTGRSLQSIASPTQYWRDEDGTPTAVAYPLDERDAAPDTHTAIGILFTETNPVRPSNTISFSWETNGEPGDEIQFTDLVDFPSFKAFGVNNIIPGITTVQDIINLFNAAGNEEFLGYITPTVASGSQGSDTIPAGGGSFDFTTGLPGEPSGNRIETGEQTAVIAALPDPFRPTGGRNYVPAGPIEALVRGEDEADGENIEVRYHATDNLGDILEALLAQGVVDVVEIYGTSLVEFPEPPPFERAMYPEGGATEGIDGGLLAVSSDGTLTGRGLSTDVLKVANPFTNADEAKLDAFPPLWAAGVHAVGDQVAWAEKIYRCIAARTASNTGNPATDTTGWAEVGTGGDGSGQDGDDGRGITSITLKQGTDNVAVITYTDNTTSELALPQGPAGADGQDGQDGQGFTSANVDHLGALPPLWAAGVHAVDDQVSWAGKVYRCLVARQATDTDNPATDTTGWAELGTGTGTGAADGVANSVDLSVSGQELTVTVGRTAGADLTDTVTLPGSAPPTPAGYSFFTKYDAMSTPSFGPVVTPAFNADPGSTGTNDRYSVAANADYEQQLFTATIAGLTPGYPTTIDYEGLLQFRSVGENRERRYWRIEFGYRLFPSVATKQATFWRHWAGEISQGVETPIGADTFSSIGIFDVGTVLLLDSDPTQNTYVMTQADFDGGLPVEVVVRLRAYDRNNTGNRAAGAFDLLSSDQLALVAFQIPAPRVAPTGHKRYVGWSAAAQPTLTEFNAGEEFDGDVLTIPSTSQDGFLWFAIPADVDSPTAAYFDGNTRSVLQAFDQRTNIETDPDGTANSGDEVDHKVWSTFASQRADILGTGSRTLTLEYS